jgi:hypothetical protein
MVIGEDALGATVKRTGSLEFDTAVFWAKPCGALINIDPIRATQGL